MLIMGIDPSPEFAYYIIWDTEKQEIKKQEILYDWEIKLPDVNKIVCEDIACYGMPVGKTVFDTAKMIGRIIEKGHHNYINVNTVYRRDIKMYFCNSMKAKDSNIRQAIMDKFGGKSKAKGNKKAPGKLYKVKKDWWSALALCLYWEYKYLAK